MRYITCFHDTFRNDIEITISWKLLSYNVLKIFTRYIYIYISELDESKFNKESFHRIHLRAQSFLGCERICIWIPFHSSEAPTHLFLIHKFITAKRNFVIKKNNLMHVLACTRKPHHRSSSNLSRRHRSWRKEFIINTAKGTENKGTV